MTRHEETSRVGGSHRLLAVLLALIPFAVGCPQRWDPDTPPGVSRGAASAGDEQTPEGPPPDLSFGPRDEFHEGVLADGDHVLSVDGTLYDEFAFAATVGASIVITMESADFDPYLHLIGPGREQLAHMGTPPGEGGRIAEIVLVAPDTGEYRIYANALESAMRGAYRLRVVVETPPRATPEER